MSIFNGWSYEKESVLPIYHKLIAAGLKIWVYRYIITLFLFYFYRVVMRFLFLESWLLLSSLSRLSTSFSFFILGVGWEYFHTVHT